MKAVIYHADAHRAKKWSYLPYKDLIAGMKENLNSYGIEMIHLTLEGFPGWGDINYYYPGVPDQITYNREVCFANFLKNQSEDGEQYWFTEADVRLRNPFPLLGDDVDASFVVSLVESRFIPTWRLAKKSAAPIFEEAVSHYTTLKNWDGDTPTWARMYSEMGSPSDNAVVSYKGLTVETRAYKPYNMSSSKYTAHYKAKNKSFLLENNHLFINPEYKK